jgi:hypothetical protein
MVKTGKLIHLWLVLLLALGPSVAAMAAVQAAAHDQHHAAAAHVQGEGSQAGGDHHGAGHNHNACGAQCLAALPSLLLPMSGLFKATQYAALSVPVTGTVVAPSVRPPQILPG